MPTYAYAGTESANVIVCEFFPDGRLEHRQTIAVDPNEKGLPNGSASKGIGVEWVLVHPGLEVVYALISSWDHAIGTIRVSIVGASGELTNYGDLVPTGGYQPCHALIDGSLMIVAHYLSGNATVFDVSDARRPRMLQNAPMPNLVTGTPWREGPFTAGAMGAKTPLCHGVAVSPAGGWLVAADAGQTAVVAYKYDPSSPTPLGEPRHQPLAPPAPVGEHHLVGKIGDRPRHVCFSADAALLFVLHEFNNVVTVHSFDAASGDVGPAIGEQPSFRYDPAAQPAGAFHAAAEVAVHRPSGRVLVSTRGLGPGFKWIEGASFLRTFSGGAPLTATQDVATQCNPRHFAFWGPQQEYCVVVVKGGFTTYGVSSAGELGVGVDSTMPDGELSIDCVALLEK